MNDQDRELARMLRYLGDALCIEAADRLEALSGEVERLEAAQSHTMSETSKLIDEYGQESFDRTLTVNAIQGRMYEAERQRDDAIAEVERLRELLRRALPWMQELCSPQLERRYAERARPLYSDICQALATDTERSAPGKSEEG